jgi:hypothetical protein
MHTEVETGEEQAILAEFRATFVAPKPEPEPERTEAEKAEIATFEAEHGRKFAPSSLSDEKIRYAEGRAEQLQKDHPPPFEAIVMDRSSGLLRGIVPQAAPAPVQQRGGSREQRPRAARRISRRGQRSPPKGDDSEPALAPRRRLTAAERRVLKLLVDTRRREIIAAGIQLTEADRALVADDVAEQQGVR